MKPFRHGWNIHPRYHPHIRAGAALLLALIPVLSSAIVVHPGPNAQSRLREALTLAQPGEAIILSAGVFRLEETLNIAVESAIVRGAGPNRTILSFHPTARATTGLQVEASGVQLQGFSVQGVSGTAIRVADCTDIWLKDMRVQWTPDRSPGLVEQKGLEIVRSQDVLVENLRVSGSSATGVWISHAVRVLFRAATLQENRLGMHIEDSRQVDIRDSTLRQNATGMRLISLQAGMSLQRVRIFGNQIDDNNDFGLPTPMGRVDSVPRGGGIIVAGGRDIEIFGNEFGVHSTFHILIRASDRGQFPDRIRIRDNQFGRHGYAPDIARVQEMIRAGDGRLAAIIWDGEVPWLEMIGLRSRTGRIVLGSNGDADFVNLDMPWYHNMRALHAPKRNYERYVGSLRPLPDVLFISRRIQKELERN